MWILKNSELFDRVNESFEYKKRFLLRLIHHIKSDMDHMRIAGTEPSPWPNKVD